VETAKPKPVRQQGLAKINSYLRDKIIKLNIWFVYT